jgi:hypothetical protein
MLLISHVAYSCDVYIAATGKQLEARSELREAQL